MTLSTCAFDVRGRGVASGFGLLALCAALAVGFVAATWGGPAAGAPLDAERRTGISSGLAVCACPVPAFPDSSPPR